jgi:hypothetical protein
VFCWSRQFHLPVFAALLGPTAKNSTISSSGHDLNGSSLSPPIIL